MKFFAIYTKVEITNEPSWLNKFRGKYLGPYDFHVTLKQPCFIKDEETEKLKNKVDKYFKNISINNIGVDFSKFVFRKPDSLDDGCIMISSSNQKDLLKLQNNLVNCLEDYKDYRDPRTKKYEENFIPHITIGCDLSLGKFNKAVSELPQKTKINAVIDEVVLAIVADDSEDERKNPKNLTNYQLSHL